MSTKKTQDQPEYPITTTPAAKRTRARSPFAVTITLEEELYRQFEQEAKDDERELGRYIARLLRAFRVRQLVNPNVALDKQEQAA